MDKLQTHYDSIMQHELDSIVGDRDSLMQAEDSMQFVELDSIRELLYDSLYDAVYYELYSQSADANLDFGQLQLLSILSPAVYPLQDSIYRGTATANLVSMEIINISKTAYYKVGIRAKVPGFTETIPFTTIINAGQKDTLFVSPALIWENFSNLSEIQLSQIEYELFVIKNDKECPLWSGSADIEVEPVNMVPRAYPDKSGDFADLTPFFARWVQIPGDSIEEVVKSAIALHPTHKFVGYQNASHINDSISIVTAQVKAIYEAIQDRGINYVAGPISPAGQRVRTPEQTLKSRAANCIDGAILFAATLASVGIHPVIVIIPGHAFVGWKVWNDKNTLDFLETTMTWGDATFDEAVAYARDEFDEETTAGHFTDKSSQILDIVELQQSGITAFPVQLKY
jgi:hypothetical protein